MDSSNPTIVDVARLIAEGKVAGDYQFFIVLAVLAILTGLVVWYVAPYLGERGKLLAMAEKLEERLNDIRQTTEAAEDVRTRIAHSDWTTKEYKTLLRNKLEQLIGAAYRVKAASEVDAIIKDRDLDLNFTSDEPLIEMRLLSPLYFSVMDAEISSFIKAHSQFAIWLLDKRSNQIRERNIADYERSQYQRILSGEVLDGVTEAQQFAIYQAAHDKQIVSSNAWAQEYEPLDRALSDALTTLAGRAALLMEELITPAA